MNQAKFTLISMGLIRYSCGHILGHHEPIHVKFGVWRFFIMLYRNMVMKMLKCKTFWWRHTSVLYMFWCVHNFVTAKNTTNFGYFQRLFVSRCWIVPWIFDLMRLIFLIKCFLSFTSYVSCYSNHIHLLYLKFFIFFCLDCFIFCLSVSVNMF